MFIAAALNILLEPNHVKKTPEIGGECGKKGVGLVGEFFWTRFCFSCQSVFYLLYSVYSSFKDTVTSSKSAESSLCIFQ